MKVTLLQMSSIDDKAANLAQAERLIDAAALAEAPDLLVLPEVWTFQGGTPQGARESAEPAVQGEAYGLLARKARQHGINIHGGSFNERDGNRVFNSSFVFDREGREVARYRKIHLFDMTGADGSVYQESALYAPGEDLVVSDVEGVRLGCTICYDLRFAELFLRLASLGAHAIVLPAAFTLMTGKDHWETLCRARAIETQCFVLAPNQWGAYQEEGETRMNYGRSMIVCPWGTVLAQAPDGIGLVSARLDLEYLHRVRARMPVATHRKLALPQPRP